MGMGHLSSRIYTESKIVAQEQGCVDVREGWREPDHPLRGRRVAVWVQENMYFRKFPSATMHRVDSEGEREEAGRPVWRLLL
jgi:hypothetical protein